MRKFIFLLLFAVTSIALNTFADTSLEERYKRAAHLCEPFPNVYDQQYYIISKPVTANQIADELDLPLDSLHRLLRSGTNAALYFYDYTHSGISVENYNRYTAAVDYLFQNPENNRCKTVNIDGKDVPFVLFLPTGPIIENVSPQSGMEAMRQKIWRPATAGNGYEVFVAKGQNWVTTAMALQLTLQQLQSYNPAIPIDGTAREDYIISVPYIPSHNGGTYAWSDLNQTQHYKILDNYSAKLISGELARELSLNEKLKLGGRLYHYHKISIDGEPFWYISGIGPEVTANQIAQILGIPIDKLEAYCKYAISLKDSEDADGAEKSDTLRQYYLSHPTTTVKELGEISRSMFQGSLYAITLYIPENISSLKFNADGSVAYPAVIPSKIESVKTLRKFFSNSPGFKCPQTGVALTLTYTAAEGFVAYVDGKRLGKFEVEVRQDKPTMALIGLPWLKGWGPAPLVLTVDAKNTNLMLLPVQGEENLSYNSHGYLQPGRTGNTNWLQLTLSSDGISFTPVNYRPDPELFWFTGFTN